MTEKQRYTYETEIHGEGGFGKVKKGRDNVLERDIAVKVLNPLGTTFDQDSIDRFRREARILAALSHPNIPAIYDVHFGAEAFLIYFQFIHGKTLQQIIDAGPTPLNTAKQWLLQIASALDHAHSKGITAIPQGEKMKCRASDLQG